MHGLLLGKPSAGKNPQEYEKRKVTKPSRIKF